MHMRIFASTIHRMHRDHDQWADQSPFVKGAERIRDVPRLIADRRLKKRRVPVVQVKHRMPVVLAIKVSRQKDIDSSVRTERTASSKRVVSVKISRGMPPINDGELPMAALAHGFSSAWRVPARRTSFLFSQVPRPPRFVQELRARIQGFAGEPGQGSKEPLSDSGGPPPSG